MQAPHSPSPQPNLGPDKPNSLRKKLSKGVLSGAVRAMFLALMVIMFCLGFYQDTPAKPSVWRRAC
jgi:hypothetical protein